MTSNGPSKWPQRSSEVKIGQTILRSKLLKLFIGLKLPTEVASEVKRGQKKYSEAVTLKLFLDLKLASNSESEVIEGQIENRFTFYVFGPF